MSRGTWGAHPESPAPFAYRAFTLYGSPFQAHSTSTRVLSLPGGFSAPPSAPPQPRRHNAAALSRDDGLGSSLFARRYWGSRACFLLLGVLRCFSSPACLPRLMYWAQDDPASPGSGCPIRVPPDHCLLAAPRSFSQLAAPFLGCSCLGIHRAPLVACSPPISPRSCGRDVP